MRNTLIPILLWVMPSVCIADIKLPPVFSDGVVLQRESSAPIWGLAEAGEKVTLALNGQTASATADTNGKWQAAFQKLAPGGPFTLTITGEKSAAVTISNVLVGDVWLCSGQSNMTLSIGAIKDFDPEVVTSAKDPLLRCYTAPNAMLAAPAEKFPAIHQSVTTGPSTPLTGDITSASDKPAAWQETTPENVEGFTAMGYYFARELRKNLGVPIGIVHASFGGSSVEAWVPRDALGELGVGDEVDAQVSLWQNADSMGEKYLTGDLAAWEAKYGRQGVATKEPDKGLDAGWANPEFDASSWTPLDALGDWKSLHLTNGGVVWARKEVDLTKSAAGKELTLNMGTLLNPAGEYGNMVGTIYFNGKEVGTVGHKLQHLFSMSDAMTTPIPGELVKAGKNVIAIRIISQKQTGPTFGTTKNPLLLPHIPAKVWSKPWLVHVEATFEPLTAEAKSSRPLPPPVIPSVGVSTVLYNGMISPLVGYGIKGFLWDQGTANGYNQNGSIYGNDRPGNYEKLFSKLILDWRAKWKAGDVPFVFTQHPNFGGIPKDPPASDLARIREAQLFTWEKIPNSFMAVTLGLITDGNIHYKNKKEAGRLLSLAALAGVYGQKVEASGPIYDSMTVEGHKIRIQFSHLGGGLVAKDGPLKMFAIAGADQKFVWADAAIDGDTVVVSSKLVTTPVAVRYAWADNPVGSNLFNKAGLPASPFRTDTWETRH